MPTWKRSHKNKGPWKQGRRKQALKLLEQDLNNGTIRTGDGTRPMEEEDKKRIMKEIQNVKNKL